MKTRPLGLLLSIVISFLFLSATYHVPADFPTIQGAINACQAGDQVIVSPGLYVENIDYLSKAITVRAKDGFNVTTIDGNQAGSVVKIYNCGTESSVIDGFTITNGTGTAVGSETLGGGIYCYGSNPTISNNSIRGNSATTGGGIAFWCESAVLNNNKIIENTASSLGAGIFAESTQAQITLNWLMNNAAGWEGGGIYFGSVLKKRTGPPCSDAPRSQNLIADNSIAGNSAAQTGGGITCMDQSADLVNNRIALNTSQWGGGVYMDVSYAYQNYSLVGNDIEENTATVDGGGLYFTSGLPPLLVNNTVTGNKAAGVGGGCVFFSYWDSHIDVEMINNTFAENSATQGGAIYCRHKLQVTSRNNIFWDNQADIGEQLYLKHTGSPMTFAISHSDLQGGRQAVAVEPGAVLEWGPGMIDEDPIFLSILYGDYHLKARSPCVNRGSSENAPSEDRDGDPRPYMGSVDMGSDEVLATHPLETSVFSLSGSSGGTVPFILNAGMHKAGRGYCLLGSRHDNAPGTPLPGGQAVLPLQWDGFTDLVLGQLNTPRFSGFLGGLDGTGCGSAAFTVTPGVLPPTWLGRTLFFAYALDEPFEFASNPLAIELVP